MQRTDRAGSFVRRVETIGFFERVGIYGDDRVDGRAFFVERFDAIEIHLHQLAASELAGFVGGVNVVDGGFDKIEGSVGLSHGKISLFH